MEKLLNYKQGGSRWQYSKRDENQKEKSGSSGDWNPDMYKKIHKHHSH